MPSRMSPALLLCAGAALLVLCDARRNSGHDVAVGGLEGKEMCRVRGPTGSGLVAHFKMEGACTLFKCRNKAFWETSAVFSAAFDAEKVETSGKSTNCECRSKESAAFPNGGGIKWRIHTIRANTSCSSRDCWEFFKSAYDLGRRERSELLGVFGAPNWDGECVMCDNDLSDCKAFKFTDTLFYHVRQQASRDKVTVELVEHEKLEQTPPRRVEQDPSTGEMVEHEKLEQTPTRHVEQDPSTGEMVEQEQHDKTPKRHAEQHGLDDSFASADTEKTQLRTISLNVIEQEEQELDRDADTLSQAINLPENIGYKGIDKDSSFSLDDSFHSFGSTGSETRGEELKVKKTQVAKFILDQIEVQQDPWPGMMKALERTLQGCGVTQETVGPFLDEVEEDEVSEDFKKTMCTPDCANALHMMWVQNEGCEPQDEGCDDADDMLYRLFQAGARCRERKRVADMVAEMKSLSGELIFKCNTSRDELMAFDVRQAVLKLQLPAVCAAETCEEALANFAGIQGCGDPLCPEYQIQVSNLYAASAQCRHLANEVNVRDAEALRKH